MEALSRIIQHSRQDGSETYWLRGVENWWQGDLVLHGKLLVLEVPHRGEQYSSLPIKMRMETQLSQGTRFTRCDVFLRPCRDLGRLYSSSNHHFSAITRPYRLIFHHPGSQDGLKGNSRSRPR